MLFASSFRSIGWFSDREFVQAGAGNYLGIGRSYRRDVFDRTLHWVQTSDIDTGLAVQQLDGSQ